MNILFINGSPNKNGNTKALAEKMLKGKAYETLKKYCKERSHCEDCAFLKNGKSWAWIDLPKMDNPNYK